MWVASKRKKNFLKDSDTYRIVYSRRSSQKYFLAAKSPSGRTRQYSKDYLQTKVNPEIRREIITSILEDFKEKELIDDVSEAALKDIIAEYDEKVLTEHYSPEKIRSIVLEYLKKEGKAISREGLICNEDDIREFFSQLNNLLPTPLDMANLEISKTEEGDLENYSRTELEEMKRIDQNKHTPAFKVEWKCGYEDCRETGSRHSFNIQSRLDNDFLGSINLVLQHQNLDERLIWEAGRIEEAFLYPEEFKDYLEEKLFFYATTYPIY